MQGLPVSRLRHRAEIPMLIVAGVLTVIGLIGAVAVLTSDQSLDGWRLLAVIGLAFPLFHGTVGMRYFYWRTISNAIEINERQLPEIYREYRAMAAAMGIDDPPRLYLMNGNGTMNAFASKCQVRKAYIVVYSDIVDLALVHGDMAALRFVLAHELGHVLCGHVDLWRLAITAVPHAAKIGASVTRAQEYTADRVASYYAPDGRRGMMALFAGKNVYKHCDHDAYLASVRDHRDGFWLRVVNFMADHAVGFRRLTALARSEEEGWDVHGKML
jgi:Zn-dependent protease with chaperone function